MALVQILPKPFAYLKMLYDIYLQNVMIQLQKWLSFVHIIAISFYLTCFIMMQREDLVHLVIWSIYNSLDHQKLVLLIRRLWILDPQNKNKKRICYQLS